MTRRPVLAIAGLAGLMGSAMGQSTLVMRGVAEPPPGQVTGVSLGGVTLAFPPAPGAGPGSLERTLSWDQVARVEGALAADATQFLPMAESMWRARTRLDRADPIGAEPIFEELFPKFAGLRGPSAAVVCGGLMRCRIMEGAQAAAVAPFLAYINALEEGHATGLPMPGFDLGAAPAVDPALQVAPLLPPVWVDLPPLQALARGGWPLSEQGDARPRALRLQALYSQAARFEAGLPPPALDASNEKDEGVALVAEVVIARVGDEAQRAAARQALTARLKKRPPAWIEVWCRVGIGRSLLREPSRDAQMLGVGELLEVPARLERVNPYLTGVALAESAVTLHKNADPAGATRLRTELSDAFPGHPALEWDALRSWPNASPVKAAPPLPLPRTTSDDLDSKGGPT